MGGKWFYNPFTDELDYYSEGGLPNGGQTNYAGSVCSGINGRTGRVLAHSTTPKIVVVDNQFLHPSVDYSVSGFDITFVNEIWDSQKITVLD